MAQKLQPRFLDYTTARTVSESFGTPVYVYDQKLLEANAVSVLKFPNAFGLTARYAMKASPNGAILKIFAKAGIHIDASSGYEVHRAMASGIPAKHISLSAQELPADLSDLLKAGIQLNACFQQVIKVGRKLLRTQTNMNCWDARSHRAMDFVP